MNKFISTLLVGSLCLSFAFGGYVKVPKKQKMQYRLEPAQSDHVNHFHGSTPIVMPNTRNSGSFAVVDSSTNGYGLVSQNTRPLHVDKMMSVGLHCRLIGRPGRIQSLKKFLNYVSKFKDIWICKRVDIAKHWIKNYS